MSEDTIPEGLEPVKLIRQDACLLIRQVSNDKPVKYFSPPTHTCNHCGSSFICSFICNKKICKCLTTKKKDSNNVINTNYFCDYFCYDIIKSS